jgi:hypothetical protein
VKTRPLPDTDLARIAPLPLDQKRNALEALRLGHPPYRYTPVRGSFSDILNLEAGMFDPGRVPFDKIAAEIRKKSWSDDEEEANLRVAEGLYDFVTLHRLRGRRHDFYPFAIGVGASVIYWHSAILLVDGQPFVPFFDPRRSKLLTSLGRRFAFSMMHQRIREGSPDFKDVRFGIFQFEKTEEGPRPPKLYTDYGVALFSLDELERMVAETYELWREVCEGRETETRRRGGQRGPLI